MSGIERLHPEDIAALGNRRPVDRDAVTRLAESMKAIGLRTPIAVRIVEEWVEPETGEIVCGQPILVAGAHRLAAAKLLGWEFIDCYIHDDDETTARMWEIAENLHRADLTTLQRSEQIAEWVRLVEQRSLISAQVAQKLDRGRPEGGFSAASRELGIDRDRVRRAVKIAGIDAEARIAAREAGIDDNQSALERVARSGDQLAEIRKIVTERETRKVETLTPVDPWRSQYDQLMRCWERAGQDARRRFLEDIEHDQPMKSFISQAGR